MRYVFVLVILASAITGQRDPGFEKIIGGAGFDRGVDAKQTSDGGYIAVGATGSYGKGGEDVYLVKTDSRGRLEWSRSYGGREEDNGWSVQENADGFLVAGFTK
ncbi:MAG: hypothetical protein OEQ28_10605, partial [Acidobacteriota bacterium]|nr:hypothetical protein [Acidobacteriota bacterium]